MEIKAKLNKPYEEEQRMDFIVQNNHTLGYEIRETDVALEAWGHTADEKSEINKEIQIEELKQKLNELDLKAIRSIRAIMAGTSTNADLEKLEEIEEQANILRNEIF